jgi:hypothetical protein
VEEALNPSYPLMRPDQVERLGVIQAVFADVTQGLPRLSERDEIRALQARLGKLEGLMTLKCLRIGMLGSSGSGKSTTVSNLLGVPESEGPTPQGGGGAGTGVATRIRVAEPGSPVRMRLEFMTREQYSSRLADLVSLIPDLGEAEPGELLVKARGALVDGQGRPEEVRSLIRLLEAYQTHGARLGTIDDTVPFEDRAKVLLHAPEGAPPGFTPLLRQVVIDFPTDRIDPRLELIDLPGLGVANRADEKLTISFLDELNGAFIFLRAVGVNDEQAAKLLEKLMEYFPRLAPRVWLIISGFDSLDGAQMGESIGDRSVLSYLADYLASRRIARGRAILVGNHLYQAWIHQAGRHPELANTPARISSEIIARGVAALNLKINLKRGTDGEPIVPPKFRDYEGWAREFEESVLVDGGIGRLRETIKKEVFLAVREEERAKVDAELGALVAGMIGELSSAKARSHMDPRDLVKASHWQSELQALGRAKLRRDRSYYDPEARALEKALVDYLDSVIRTDLPIHDPDWPGQNMLDRLHRTHCRNLRATSLEMAPGLVRAMFERVDAHVMAVAVGTLQTGPQPLRDPKAAWSERTRDDRTDPAWYRPVFESLMNELVFAMHLDQAASVYPKEDYLGLMKHKVQAVVREFIRLTLDKIAGRLKGLGDELLLIGDGADSADAQADAVYNDLIARLAAAKAPNPNGAAI